MADALGATLYRAGIWMALAVLPAAQGCDSTSPVPAPGTDPAPPVWTLERETTIGSLDDPAQSLTTIGGLAVDREGRIYVSQPKEQEVKVFSPHGALLNTIGRRGEGPGEFSRPGKVGWLADTLWVAEIRMPKISFFEADGSFVRSTLLQKAPLEELSGQPGPITVNRIDGVLADGTLLARTTSSGQQVLDGIISQFPYLRLDTDGNFLAHLADMAVGNSILQVDLGGGRGVGLPHPFPTRPILAQSPSDDTVLQLDLIPEEGDRDPKMRLHKINAAGDTVFTRELPCPPLHFSPEYLEEIALPLAERLTQNSASHSPRQVLPAIIEGLDLPSSAPPALNLAVSTHGEIWIQRNTPGALQDKWEVYSPEGSLLATLDAPPGTVIHAVDGPFVWATESDDLGVSYVVRYRIVRE